MTTEAAGPLAGGQEGLRFLLSDEPEPETRRIIHEEIKAFNDAVSQHHRAIRGAGARPLQITIRDEQGQLLGGLVADTYWGWLDIDDLWLHESLRGLGYGRKLMAMAETEALARGCLHAFVRTFSFQARGFYEQLGYRVVGRLDDYPPGESFFWLRKEISRDLS
jgi:ribosomal protein S18 acetylase RimI-like enzyme